MADDSSKLRRRFLPKFTIQMPSFNKAALKVGLVVYRSGAAKIKQEAGEDG